MSGRRFGRMNVRIGVGVLSVSLAMALVSAFYTPFDPVRVDLAKSLMAPGFPHLLGTDQFGRDILSRLMSAAHVSMQVSFMTVCIAVAMGAVFGITMGFLGGWTDRIGMVFLDSLMAIPGILLALAIMVIVGPGRSSLIIALGAAYTPTVARLVRGVSLSIREQEYIAASKLDGNSRLYTMVRHVTPNCATPLTVIATSLFAWALLAESALSFLGLGVPPPRPTWGGMLADGRQYLVMAPWMSIFPGLAISMTLLGVNLLGDALRDRFDPRMNNVLAA